jgi:hypothetical protein
VRDGGEVFCRERCASGGYMAMGTSANGYAASSREPYELVECVDEWDVVPVGVAYGVKGSGTEEEGEVDLVSGGVAFGTFLSHPRIPVLPMRKDRVRGKTRRRESKWEVVPESVCSPKMRKGRKADVPAPTYAPPRVGNGAFDAGKSFS